MYVIEGNVKIPEGIEQILLFLKDNRMNDFEEKLNIPGLMVVI